MRSIRGVPGSGKTATVFRQFKEALRQGRAGVRLVVPTATLVRHFQHEMARDGEVFPPSAIVSLSRFTRELTPQLKQVPDALLRLIVRDALRRLEVWEFAQVSETKGMVSTIVETIALFENAGTRPDQLPARQPFGKLWREVEAKVHRCGYATRPEILKAAASNLSPMRIWMDGFITLSPIEKGFIAALDRQCNLTLTETVMPDNLLPGLARSAPITIVAAPSMERECDEIARRILTLRQEGSAFRQIAIALRDPGSYLSLLRSTLERFGIPARVYFSTDLQYHSAARFLNGLIRNVVDGWEFGFALQTLREHPGWGKTAAFDRFDFKVREEMPGRGADKLASHCENDLRERLRVCFFMDVWRDNLLTPQQWKDRFRQMSESVYRPGTLDPPHAFTSVESERSHIAALRAWNEAIACAADFFAPEAPPVSLATFWEVAAQAVESGTIQNRDDRGDVVHVMSVYEARQWDVGTLFVCGLTDRDFPKKNPQNLLFPDAEIDALRKAGIVLRKASDLDGEERGLFDSLKSRASESLILTWPQHDAAGKSVESSRFLAELDQVPAQPQLCRATPAVLSMGAGMSGRLNSAPLLASLAVTHQKIGLTALEDLAQCRFKFFAGKTLGLKGRPERPQDRLSPRVNGLIMHKALELWLNTGRTGSFIEVFDTAFDDYCHEKHVPPGYRCEVERVFLRDIARGVGATERWTPLASQAEVDLAIAFPGGVTVNCRVDRIDRMSETECVIVDYKSGKTAGVARLIESTVKLQGPLYALAVKETLNLNTIAMMYVAVREDKPFGWGDVPGASLHLTEMPARWIEDARDRAIERLSNFLSGAIHADPVEPERCQWCEYASACRYTKEAALTEVAHGA